MRLFMMFHTFDLRAATYTHMYKYCNPYFITQIF